MTRLLVAILAVVPAILAGPATADEALTADVTARLTALVARLGDPSWKVRDTAQRELRTYLDSDAKAAFMRSRAKGAAQEQSRRIERALRGYKHRKHGRIYFVNEARQLWVMDHDGTGPQQVFTHVWMLSMNAQYALSETAGVLLFTSNAFGRDGWWLCSVKLRGGQPRKLVNTRSNHAPRWSPDRKRIAYDSHFHTREGIHVADPACKAVRRITTSSRDRLCDWRPDGKRLAFVRHVNGQHLATIGSDGKDERIPTAKWQPYVYCGRSRWSPDGKHLLAMAIVREKDQQWDLVRIDPTGLRFSPLTRTPESESRFAWSPDGTQIAFLARGPKTAYLRLVPAGGGAPRELARVAAGSRLAWRPDGKAVVFYGTTLADRKRGLFSVDVATRKVRCLTEGVVRYLHHSRPTLKR